MPSRRLLTMGLLNKHPTKSSVLKTFLNGGLGKRYTVAERQHMVALLNTPELPRSWIRYQFEKLGLDPELAENRLIVINGKYPQYRYLGQENVQFIGQPEVQRYYDRRDKRLKTAWHPNWALPVFNDHVKQGMTQAAIARQYDISPRSLWHCLNRRSMFEPHRRHPGDKTGKFGLSKA